MTVGKKLGMLLIIVVLLAGGLAACGGGDDDDDSDAGNGVGGDEAVSEIQQVYIDAGCAECHGENGEGDGENPKTEIAGTRMIIQQFQARVRNGRGSAMPGYSEDQVTDEQIEQMWEWLRE